jgi:ribosomal protein L11 methylase PrmA
LVREYLRGIASRTVLDLGANTGSFSIVCNVAGSKVVSVDSDPACVEVLYTEFKGLDVLPLVVDLASPSPAIGWDNLERGSFKDRVHVDTVLALALIHHLAIGNNLPLSWIAKFLFELGSNLVVEFVPKSDPKVQLMLSTRRVTSSLSLVSISP